MGEELAEAVQSGQLSAARAEALAWGWQERGVDLSVLAAGLSVALAGGDVDVGAGAAENAVRHNALGGLVKVIQALEQYVKKKSLAKKERSVDDIISGSKPGRPTKGKTTQYERAGDFDQANRDFDSLGVKNVKDINTAYGPSRSSNLSDGRKVTVRPGSTDGHPTLEIRRPNKVGQEIRYY